MSDQPKEPEKTTYQRDKTAKGPQSTSDAPKIPAKPKPKIKKVFDLFTKKYNCSDNQLLLAWILKHPSNIYPVIGTTKGQRIKNSSESLKINLETIDWFEILEASVGKRVA